MFYSNHDLLNYYVKTLHWNCKHGIRNIVNPNGIVDLGYVTMFMLIF